MQQSFLKERKKNSTCVNVFAVSGGNSGYDECGIKRESPP